MGHTIEYIVSTFTIPASSGLYVPFFHLDNINLKILKFLQLRWEIKCQTNCQTFETFQPVDFEKKMTFIEKTLITHKGTTV
jgi:hypothetical protein